MMMIWLCASSAIVPFDLAGMYASKGAGYLGLSSVPTGPSGQYAGNNRGSDQDDGMTK